MTQQEALKLIDEYKNKLIDPVTMLHWTWLRAIINQIPEDQWNTYVESAVHYLSK